MNESGQRSVLVGSAIQEVLYMVYSKDAILPKIKVFFLQKKCFSGLDPPLLISVCFLAWFGEVRKRFELLLLCNKPTPLWDDQTMVCGLLSWWCICNWFLLVEALLWRWSGASDVKLGLVPSIESVETNLDGATGQMHRFLQRLASLSSCIWFWWKLVISGKGC